MIRRALIALAAAALDLRADGHTIAQTGVGRNPMAHGLDPQPARTRGIKTAETQPE